MLGYKSKQGFAVFRCRVRGGGKKMVSKGIVYGKPRNAGVNKMKCTRNLRSVAEERVGRSTRPWPAQARPALRDEGAAIEA